MVRLPPAPRTGPSWRAGSRSRARSATSCSAWSSCCLPATGSPPVCWPASPAAASGAGVCCRSGHVERYHRNLTQHWLTAESGTYRTGLFPVLGGEDVVVEFEVDQIEGSVGFRLVRYHWGLWPEHVWSEGVRTDHTGRFRIPVGGTGLYSLGLSYFKFAGDVAFDWSVD